MNPNVPQRVRVVSRFPSSSPRHGGAFPAPVRPVAPESLSTAERWSHAVAAVALAPEDVPTVNAWAALTNQSRSTLANRCRAVGARAKDSLSLGRLARTVLKGDVEPWHPEHLLRGMDERTLVSLLRQGGILSYRYGLRPSLDCLLSAHAFRIPRPTGWLLRLALFDARGIA